MLRSPVQAVLEKSFLLFAALAIFPTAVVSAAGPSGSWSQLPNLPTTQPSGRMYHGAVYDPDGGRMVVFGGHPNFLDDVWEFQLSGPPGWAAVATAGSPPTSRWGHATVYDPVRKRLIVMGGLDNTGFNRDDVHALTLTGTPTWSAITPAGAPPPGRRNHSMAYDPVRDRVLVFGGYIGGPNFGNDVWALNLSGPPVWTQLTPTGTPPAGRSMVAAAYDPVGDRIFYHGGWVTTFYSDELWQLSLAGTPAWTQVTPSGTPPGARRDHVAVYDPATTRIVYFGGSDGPQLSEVWSLSLSGSPVWSQVLPPGPMPSERASLTGVLDPVAHRMVIFGGYDTNYKNDVWGLSLGTGAEAWTRLYSQATYPPPLCDYSAIYDQPRNRTLYWSGKGVSGDYGGLWSLQLGPAPEWGELFSTPAQPIARHSHRAVLDLANSRMLMFGGWRFNYLNDVWGLALTGTPTWSLITPAGTPPAPRVYPSAITDPVRQRMVIFGGEPGFLNDVWALNFSGPPAWTQLTPIGTPPSGRWGHHAAYDPVRDQMVVFGGFDSPIGNRNDLWVLQFTPSLQWVQLAPAGGPPAARRNATIAYDSSRDRFILFGGYGPGFLNDVWELSLSGVPTWTQLSPTGGPPEMRNQMEAFYEPALDRVVVYGGWDAHFLADTWFLNFDQPTAALVSLVTARSTKAGVELAWQIGEGSDPPVAIQRTVDGNAWSTVAAASLTPSRRVEWTDTSAPARGRVGYRLQFEGAEGASVAGEAWVDLAPQAEFALYGVAPNPVVERAYVALALPARRAASIEVLDIAGRRVLMRDLGTLDPGEHRITLDGMRELPAGMYQVRLKSGTDVASTRMMVVR